MDPHFTLVAISLIALAVDVAIQLVVFRTKGRDDVWGSVLVGFVGGLLIVTTGSAIAVSALPISDAIFLVLMNVVSFAALGYGYFTFVNLNFTSLRVRVLRELSRSGGHLTQQQLLAEYNAQQALTLRLDRLLQKHQLNVRDGRYHVGATASFLFLAYVLDAFKWLLLGRQLSAGRER